MQFAGEQLEAILRRQAMPVEVVDFSGRVCLSAPGPDVIGRFVLAGYVRHTSPTCSVQSCS